MSTHFRDQFRQAFKLRPNYSEMVQPAVVTKITDEEAALYDRQIRLWGLESQNRLKNAAVLLIGVSALGAEVAKNLMLVGLKSLALMDDETVSELDLKANFLLDRATALHKNRTEAVLTRCKLLNPLVDVVTLPLEKNQLVGVAEELIASGAFDLVCCVDRSVEECLKINQACRSSSKRVLFCMGAVNGWFGYSFNDFGDNYEFATEIFAPAEQKTEQSGQPSTTVDVDDVLLSDDDEPPPKRNRAASAGASAGATANVQIQDNSQEKKREKVLVRKHTSFTALADAFKGQGSAERESGDVKRKRPRAMYPVGFYLFQIMAGFRHQHKRNPSMASKTQDVKELLLERSAVLSTLGDVKINIPENFANSLFDQVPAVCAIVGGVLAQEAIKAVSQKDEPMNNWFFYNPFDSSGAVAKIPRS